MSFSNSHFYKNSANHVHKVPVWFFFTLETSSSSCSVMISASCFMRQVKTVLRAFLLSPLVAKASSPLATVSPVHKIGQPQNPPMPHKAPLKLQHLPLKKAVVFCDFVSILNCNILVHLMDLLTPKRTSERVKSTGCITARWYAVQCILDYHDCPQMRKFLALNTLNSNTYSSYSKLLPFNKKISASISV